MTLNIAMLQKPVAQLDIAGSPLFFYRLRVKDLSALSKLDDSSPDKTSRTLLTCIASREARDGSVKTEPSRVSLEEVKSWPAELLNQALLVILDKRHVLFGVSPDQSPYPSVDAAASPSENVAALVQWAVDQEKERHRKLIESIKGTSFSKVYDWASDAENRRAETMAAFDRSIQEMNRRLVDQRNHELEDAHRTAEAAIRAAISLDQLSKEFFGFAKVFIESLAEQQRSQRASIRVAIATFLVGLCVAIVGTIFTIKSYLQDTRNNETNDKWQTEVLEVMKSHREREAVLDILTREVSRLRAELDKRNASPQANPPSLKKAPAVEARRGSGSPQPADR